MQCSDRLSPNPCLDFFAALCIGLLQPFDLPGLQVARGIGLQAPLLFFFPPASVICWFWAGHGCCEQSAQAGTAGGSKKQDPDTMHRACSCTATSWKQQMHRRLPQATKIWKVAHHQMFSWQRQRQRMKETEGMDEF